VIQSSPIYSKMYAPSSGL